MKFVNIKDQLEKSMLKYQKDADNYGVSADEWIITKLTETELNIKIGNNITLNCKSLDNKDFPISVILHDIDENETFEITTPEHIGKTKKDTIKTLNACANWIISNVL